MFALSVNKFLDEISGFSEVRDPLETHVEEFFLNEWGNNAVSGHSGDETEGWVLLDEVETLGMDEVEVVSHGVNNACEKNIKVVVVKGGNGVCDFSIGDSDVVDGASDDEVVELSLDVGVDVHGHGDCLLEDWGSLS